MKRNRNKKKHGQIIDDSDSGGSGRRCGSPQLAATDAVAVGSAVAVTVLMAGKVSFAIGVIVIAICFIALLLLFLLLFEHQVLIQIRASGEEAPAPKKYLSFYFIRLCRNHLLLFFLTNCSFQTLSG